MRKAPFSWTCPYCGQHTTVTSVNFDRNSDIYTVCVDNDRSDYTFSSELVKCPNTECGKLEFQGSLWRNDWVEVIGHRTWRPKMLLESWNMLPTSKAKPMPEYIPKEIRENYKEACLILDNSPKASAAMSRRCLQGIVRDFWEIPAKKRGNLGAEISYISDKIDDDTLSSIKAVREVGDIGAHMEKAVDTIVDVESGEAELLIELIETLIADWYIARHRRNERNATLREIVAEKREAKKISKETMLEIEDKSDGE